VLVLVLVNVLVDVDVDGDGDGDVAVDVWHRARKRLEHCAGSPRPGPFTTPFYGSDH
jgi:hypothetical protein